MNSRYERLTELNKGDSDVALFVALLFMTGVCIAMMVVFFQTAEGQAVIRLVTS